MCPDDSVGRSVTQGILLFVRPEGICYTPDQGTRRFAEDGGGMSWTFVCSEGHWRSVVGGAAASEALTRRSCADCTAAGEWIRIPPGYEVGRVLGRGGMGVVFQARQLAQERPVALKLLHPSRLGDRTLQQRFFAEADALSRVDHANVVRLLDVGRDSEYPYLAMEYVEGPTLAAWLQDHHPTQAQAISIVAALAHAMNHVHSRGILHRDLKPANILYEPCRLLKITDFGLAKFLDSDQTITASGHILGTPVYMSPEQVQGDRASIGPGTDIYALGVLLYRVLTGQLPFSGGAHLNLFYRILFELPTPPSALMSDLMPGVEEVTLRCLEKSSKDRYPCAQLLAEDLERVLAGSPTAARPREHARAELRWAVFADPASGTAVPGPLRDVLPRAPAVPRIDAETASKGAAPVPEAPGAIAPAGRVDPSELPLDALEIPLFAGLERPKVDALLSSGARRTLAAGEVLFREGDAANGLCVVLAGMIEIHRDGPAGSARLAVIEPGEIFGELGLLSYAGLRTASARALVRTVLLHLPGNPIELIRRFADSATTLRLLQNLMRLLRDRVVNQDRMRLVDQAGGAPRVSFRGRGLDAEAAMRGLNRELESAFAGHLREPGTFVAGDYLFHQGDPADGFYYLYHGEVEAVDERSAATPTSLATLHPPCTVGEIGFFSGETRSVGLRAVGAGGYIRYSLPAFEALVRSEPEKALCVLLAGVQLVLLLILERDAG